MQMNRNHRGSKATILIFFGILFLIGLITLLLPDRSVSKNERRTLASLPVPGWDSIWDGKYMQKFENYLADQVAFRDGFCTIKALTEINVLKKADTNGYFMYDDSLYQLIYRDDQKNVLRNAQKFEAISREYFPGSDIFVSVIPDKNYFLPKDTVYPTMDYEKIQKLIRQYMPVADEIPIFDCLTKEDYYRTDLHWRQERILPVADRILGRMADDHEPFYRKYVYDVNLATDKFTGGYAAASALAPPGESLFYLKAQHLDEASLFDYEDETVKGVYAWDKLGEMDDYDFYLYGPRALLNLKNSKWEGEEKNLIIFRDSFASSLAPLLLESYANVTLVDLRYVSVQYAMELLSGIEYDDVLFLYSANMLAH